MIRNIKLSDGGEIMKTAFQIVIASVAMVISIIIQNGFSLDTEQLKTLTFWIALALSTASVLIIFNLAYSMQINSIKTNEQSKYVTNFCLLKTFIESIKSRKLYNRLDGALLVYNEEYKVAILTFKLNKIVGNMTLDELFTYDFTENNNSYHKRKIKKLNGLKTKIETGKIIFEKSVPDDILRDYSYRKGKPQVVSLKENLIKLKARANLFKIMSFILTQVILAIICFRYKNDDVIKTILSQLLMSSMAIFGGITNARKYMNLRAGLMEDKVDFLIKNDVVPKLETPIS